MSGIIKCPVKPLNIELTDVTLRTSHPVKSNVSICAWENSNDPRFQVAISVIESGAGRACFASYNPFGWMSRSFSSWEEAIYAHAAYISGPIYKTNGYLTRSFASTYCPPNAENWYNNVSNEMAKI